MQAAVSEWPTVARRRFRGGYYGAWLTRSAQRAQSSPGSPNICAVLTGRFVLRKRADYLLWRAAAGLAGLRVMPGDRFPRRPGARPWAQKITELALRSNPASRHRKPAPLSRVRGGASLPSG